MDKRKIYEMCINPLLIFTSGEFGTTGGSLPTISEMSKYLNVINKFPQKEEMVDTMFGLAGISENKLNNIMNSNDNTKRILTMLDVIEKVQKYIYEIYDISLVTIYGNPEWRESIISFMKYPSKTKLGYTSVIEWELEKHHIPDEVIDKFMDVVGPQIMKIYDILQEFVDYDDEEYEEEIEMTTKTTEEKTKDLVVAEITTEKKEEVKVTAKKNQPKAKKTNKSKKAEPKKQESNNDIKEKVSQDINTDMPEIDIKMDAKSKHSDVELDAKQDVIQLSDAVNSLDEILLQDDEKTITEQMRHWKIVLKSSLYKMNGIPMDNTVLNGEPVVMDKEWREKSVLYKDGTSKCYNIKDVIFRGRFASFILNWFIENTDAHFSMAMEECKKDSDFDLDTFIKGYQKLHLEAIINVAKGKYEKGLETIADAMVAVSKMDNELYNNGLIALKTMDTKNVHVASVARMAYMMSTSKDKGIKVDDAVTLENAIHTLGESVMKTNKRFVLYDMFLKSRPSIPTKIKDIKDKREENAAVLALAFTKMLVNNKAVNKTLKMCV